MKMKFAALNVILTVSLFIGASRGQLLKRILELVGVDSGETSLPAGQQAFMPRSSFYSVPSRYRRVETYPYEPDYPNLQQPQQQQQPDAYRPHSGHPPFAEPSHAGDVHNPAPLTEYTFRAGANNGSTGYALNEALEVNGGGGRRRGAFVAADNMYNHQLEPKKEGEAAAAAFEAGRRVPDIDYSFLLSGSNRVADYEDDVDDLRLNGGGSGLAEDAEKDGDHPIASEDENGLRRVPRDIFSIFQSNSGQRPNNFGPNRGQPTSNCVCRCQCCHCCPCNTDDYEYI